MLVPPWLVRLLIKVLFFVTWQKVPLSPEKLCRRWVSLRGSRRLRPRWLGRRKIKQQVLLSLLPPLQLCNSCASVYAHCLLFYFLLNETVLPHSTVTLIWSCNRLSACSCLSHLIILLFCAIDVSVNGNKLYHLGIYCRRIINDYWIEQHSFSFITFLF